MPPDTTVATLDIISDVVCPWCYIGKRRVAQALDLIPEVPLQVRWLPYELNPTDARGRNGAEILLLAKIWLRPGRR